MPELKCTMSNHDHAVATVDEDGDVRLEAYSGGRRSVVYARPAQFAAWAREALAGTGERLESGSAVKVGDRVTIVKAAWEEDNGKDGIVGRIDPHDSDLPYRIDSESGVFIAWASAVRKVDTSDTSASTFAAHVDEAKRLLEGTVFRGADVIDLARELAERA